MRYRLGVHDGVRALMRRLVMAAVVCVVLILAGVGWGRDVSCESSPLAALGPAAVAASHTPGHEQPGGHDRHGDQGWLHGICISVLATIAGVLILSGHARRAFAVAMRAAPKPIRRDRARRVAPALSELGICRT